MHPFLDGNGRTARALEALMLQRLGLRDTLFIAMSNYYYEEKTSYLQALNAVRTKDHDLTDFLAFALRGIERQCRALFDEINLQIKRAIFINTAMDLFGRLSSPRKRVVSERQLRILRLLLDRELALPELMITLEPHCALGNPKKALIRDLKYLLEMGAIEGQSRSPEGLVLWANLEWPKEIDDDKFLAVLESFPKSKVLDFLSR
jgi:Fic family protein